MIIVVLGRAGSGKSVVSKEVCKLTDLPLVEMSSIVQKLQQRSKEQRGQININKDQREKKDPDWLWREVHEEILRVGKGHNKSCVVSGIREPYLLHKLLTESIDPTIGAAEILIIGLEVSKFNRYSRLCSRDGFMSVKEFRAIDEGTKEKDEYVGDNELGLDITLTSCDMIIDGNKSLEQVVKDIDKELFDRNIYFKVSK